MYRQFETLVDLTAQKYPKSKIIISSLLVRNDNYESNRCQLNNKISRIHPYPNVHFVNNGNITQEMLFDRKHIKKRKIGVLVANLKDCIFNRIPKIAHQTTSQYRNQNKTPQFPTPSIPFYNFPNHRPHPTWKL